MSLKYRFSTLLAVAVATLAFGTFTFAQDTTTSAPTTTDKAVTQGGHHGFGRGDKAGRRRFRRGDRAIGALRGLDLTEAQKAQLKALRQQNRPDPATFKEMHSLMVAVHDGSSTPEQQARLKDLSQQMMARRKAAREQMLNILTPDQKAELDKRKAERKERKAEFKAKRQEFRKNRKNVAPAAAPDKPSDIN